MKALAKRPAEELGRALELVEDSKRLMQEAFAKETRRAYASQWRLFEGWARRSGHEVLPASPATVCLYLTARKKDGAKLATLEQALAAIAWAHKMAKFESPRGSSEVRLLMKGVARTLGRAQAQKAPILVPALRRMVAGLSGELAGLRDRALLLLGFACAFRRRELVALNVEDLSWDVEGMNVRVRRSKTDQEGEGEVLGVHFGEHPETCPVRAVRAWLEAAHLVEGPVFRPITKGGRVLKGRLSDRSVAEVVKRHAAAAGFDPKAFAGHSLRSGLATSAARAGAHERDIARQTRHRGTKVLRRYIRAASVFENNVTKGLGL
jgi:site-specific recombinase XerD